LRPETTLLRRGAHGVVETKVEGRVWTNILVLDCFPVSQPGQLLSVQHRRDEDHAEEIGIIEDPGQWPPEQRKPIEQALGVQYLWHEIVRVHGVELVNDLLTLQVKTQLGPLELTVRRGPQWVQDVGRGKLIVDVDDNHYVLPPDERLTDRELQLLRRYADL
jgi:hypothetical protein